ncbi:hypothetical protein GDO86_004737 [Hymenochirus boettgeri]|uniref:CEP63/Deup1 CEP152 binding coiled coil domain-containing protein n=1 Tax=Hymenochirus boettgeri TaxID=247094 RepID=A0A8T2K9W2_9PIPI|nr:hypothetical protein GDO86_004737 [Hymenochirus boettgeri]
MEYTEPGFQESSYDLSRTNGASLAKAMRICSNTWISFIREDSSPAVKPIPCAHHIHTTDSQCDPSSCVCNGASNVMEDDCSECSLDSHHEWCDPTTLCPDLDFTLFSFNFVSDSPNSSFMGSSHISAAEKFLQDESKRAQDFEKILNSHIDEMRQCSEKTVSKHQFHSQHRHI